MMGPPAPMSLSEAVNAASEGMQLAPEFDPQEIVPDLAPPTEVTPPPDLTPPPAPSPLENMLPETPSNLPEAPNGLPEAPQAPAAPELQQNLLPGETGGIPTKSQLKPGLAYLADALGAPPALVDALNNPVVSNMVTSAMNSGLRGRSLQDTIERALISGAGAGAGMLATDATSDLGSATSKVAGRLANYATTSVLSGKTPDVEGFLGQAALQIGINTMAGELPDWAKPAANMAGNYLASELMPSKAPTAPVHLTAGTPTGLPTASTGTLGTSTGGGLPVSLVQKASPTDQYAASQFGQILGDESGSTNTPIRYGNQFARPMLAPGLLTTTQPQDQQTPSLFSGLTPEQASLVSSNITDQNVDLDPSLKNLLLARGYAVGGPVDFVPGPEDRLYARHYKRGFAVNGPGTGQSDDIPTMLADGEYVIDADTVAQLGDGSSKAGANILDKFREEIRKHKRSAPVDKIPPAAKSPLEYLKMARKKHG